MPTADEMLPALQLLTSYLLYDRENETELRIAFAALVQERHHHFHDLTENKETEFSQCANDKCVAALGILQNSRKPRIEINEFSAAMIAPFNLRVQKADRAVMAFLEEKGTIQPPANGVTILEA